MSSTNELELFPLGRIVMTKGVAERLGADDVLRGIFRHTVSLHRLYRNGDHWKESSRFGRDDIPLMRHVLDAAHTWIYQHADSEGSGSHTS